MKILSLIQENAKLTNRQISKKVLLPITTVHNRVKKMCKEGIIKNYTVNLNHKKLGLNILAYVFLTVNNKLMKSIEDTKKDLLNLIGPYGVLDTINTVAGTVDIILKVRTRGIEGVDNFVAEGLRSLEYIKDTQTIIVLKELL